MKASITNFIRPVYRSSPSPAEIAGYFFCMSYAEKLKDPRWQKKRLQILERDKFACTNCADTANELHVHHISYFGNPWDAEDKFLVTLCKDCHEQEEMALKESKESVFKQLKKHGFTSTSFESLAKVFEKDRNWSYYEPAFDILKMVVEDEHIWRLMETLFFERLNNSYLNRLKDNE